MTTVGIERIKRNMLKRYPDLAIKTFNVPIRENNKIDTACVVGKLENGKIKAEAMEYNAGFMDSLSLQEQTFVFAHEFLHIALEHFSRSVDKPQKDIEREYDKFCEGQTNEAARWAKKEELRAHFSTIWNIATDAAINAHLAKDGLPIPTDVKDPKTGETMQFINMPEGLTENAETIYDKLVQKEQEKKEEQEKQKEREKQEKEKGNQKEQKGDSGSQGQDGENQQPNQQNQGQDGEKQPQEGENQSQKGEQPSDGSQQDGKNGKDGLPDGKSEQGGEPKQGGENDKGEPQSGKPEQGNSQGGAASNKALEDWLDNIDIDNYKGFDSHKQWAGDKEQQKEDNKNQDKPKDKAKDSAKDKPDAQNKDDKKQEPAGSLLDKIKKLLGRGNENKPTQKNLDNANDEKNLDGSPDKAKIEPINEAAWFAKNNETRKKADEKSLILAKQLITEQAKTTHHQHEAPVLPWKRLVQKSIESDDEAWSHRRSSRVHPGMMATDVPTEKRGIAEIILDTSGSISEQLLRGFLRQLVPLFKDTDIKVGCFAGVFHGWHELKTRKQIEDFRADRDGGGTNFEAAAAAFSPQNGKRINRIVFTDGELDGSGARHNQRTPTKGILWIVFGDGMNFKPISGKIIRVADKEYKKMLSMQTERGRS